MASASRVDLCQGCTACCSGPNWQKDLDGEARFAHYESRGRIWLKKVGDGCIYRTRFGCLVHEDKPRVCADSDCLDWQGLKAIMSEHLASAVDARLARGPGTPRGE